MSFVEHVTHVKHLLAIAIAGLALASPAHAHSWYATSCCSNSDCEPIPFEAVTEMQTGWMVSYVGKAAGPVTAFVPRGRERHSQDGRFHACARPGRFLCLYVPSTV